MNPAWSVILLTTLIGAGQGLFMALWVVELGTQGTPGVLFVVGGAVALALAAAGLFASFFHLGRPERAWRSAAMWRTSWLSREVIALPLFMAGVLVWTVAHATGALPTPALGAAAALLCLALFVCTAMIYASVRFLQEWASAFTLVNYTLLGLASGCTLACALAAWLAPERVAALGTAAALLTASAWATRMLSLARNDRLKPKSTPQSAIGVRHTHVRQRSMGMMGGSFNTREFFHHRTPGALRQVRWWFIVGAFALPLLLLGIGLRADHALLLALAFAVQYTGLLAERWYFFAQARHPQNLYYQAVS
jgi:DMSO reductase anchor subunit